VADDCSPDNQIRPLLNHSSAVVRLYALLLLEAQLPHLDPAQVREALTTVEPGDEPAPRSVLSRLRESISKAPDPLEAPFPGRSLLEGEPFPPSFFLSLPGGLDPSPLPDEAKDLLSTILDRLVDHLRRGTLTEPARVWRALGQLRHPGMALAIRQFYNRGRESQEMYRALALIRTIEVEDLLVKVMATANEVMRPTLLEALGSLQLRDPILLLSQAVSSQRRAERVATARALGKCRRPGATALLLKLARDPDPDVACTALDSLALVKDREVVSDLAELASSAPDPTIRARLALVLAVLGGKEARKLLASLLSDQQPEVAAAAAHGLAAYPAWARQLTDPLARLVSSSDPMMKAAGLLTIFPQRPDQAQEALVNLLSGTDSLGRAEGSGCVRFIQTPPVVRALVDAILQETDAEALAAQTSVLSSLAPATPLSMIQPLCTHRSPEVRSAVAEFLAVHSDSQATQILVRMCQAETQALVKRRVAQSLVHRCRRDSPDRLKDFLLERDARIVATAIEDMEDLAGLEVVPFVGPLLGHTANRVRANATVALFKMGRFDGLDHLLVMLEDPRNPAFASGLYAVGRIGKALCYDSLRHSPALLSGLAERSRRRSGSPAGRLTLDLSHPRLGASPGGYPIRGLSPSSTSLDITSIIGPVKQGPQSPEAHLEVLLNDLLKGDPGALTTLREHLALYPHDQGARYVLLRILLKQGEDPGDLAEGYARETVGPFANPYIDLARVTKEHGQGTRAVGFYIRSFESSLLALQRFIDTARQRLDSEDFLGASRTLEVLSSLFPINPILHATLGEHYLSLGENEKSFEELYRAHLASPDLAVIALKLAAVCVKTQRNDLAVEVLKSLIEREEPQSSFRTKAVQILDSIETRRRKKEEKRRQQAAELFDPLPDKK